MKRLQFVLSGAVLLGSVALAQAGANPETNAVAHLSEGASNNISSGSSTNVYELDDKHPLAIGDKLTFRILEDPDYDKPLTVTDSGELDFPLIHQVKVEGKTCREVANEVKVALEKDFYNHATVVLAIDSLAKTVGKVYIIGAVRSAGAEEIPSDEILTLSKAILRAGGFTEYANEKSVQVRRLSLDGPDMVTNINVGKVMDSGKLETDFPLKAGDTVIVPEKWVRGL